MSEEVKTMIVKYGLEIILAILGFVLTVVATKIQRKNAQKQNGDIANESAKNVVLAVEQMYKDLHGSEKLEKALGMLTESLSAKGIKLNASEIRVLIESAVGQFNKVFVVEEKPETPKE